MCARYIQPECDARAAHYPEDRDVTALEWLRDIVGASDRVIALAESIYANDCGCSLANMGMHEAIVEHKQWVYGDKYLVSGWTCAARVRACVRVRARACVRACVCVRAYACVRVWGEARNACVCESEDDPPRVCPSDCVTLHRCPSASTFTFASSFAFAFALALSHPALSRRCWTGRYERLRRRWAGASHTRATQAVTLPRSVHLFPPHKRPRSCLKLQILFPGERTSDRVSGFVWGPGAGSGAGREARLEGN